MENIHELLKDDYSFEEAEKLQMKYQGYLKDNKKRNENLSLNSIKKVVGVDISYYTKGNNEYGVACAVLWDIDQKRVEEHIFAQDIINFSYKSGFLGFRENKLIAKAIMQLQDKPDLLMCDGHGIIHPRRFGEAVHLGIALNVSTFGVAKKFFIGYSNWKEMKRIKGNKVPIWAENPSHLTKNSLNELLGYAICLNDSFKPVYVSEGHKFALEVAIDVCLNTTLQHRQPEPLFLADQLSREKVKQYKSVF